MTRFNGFKLFLKVLFTPRVIILIAIGTAVMFLTFFTQDNAMELGISGIASVFIGIGVNNFTIVETENRDRHRLQVKLQNTIDALQKVQKRVNGLKHIRDEHPENVPGEVEDISDFIQLCIHYLKEN